MKTVVNTRIDSHIKITLQEMAKKMGIPLSSLISAALTKVAHERKLEMVAPQEEWLTPEYEQELLNNPDMKETVFVAENAQDIDKFFNSL